MINQIYIDLDPRMFNRALKVMAIIDDKAICIIGRYDVGFEPFHGRYTKPKIRIDRLENGKLFERVK